MVHVWCRTMSATLLTTNTKLKKNIKLGWQSWGIHLSPSSKSGFNVCKDASPGCIAACLDTSGMGGFSNVQQARINKTRFFFQDKQGFLSQLKREIGNKIKTAKRKGIKVSFRLNLTSDLPWEKIRIDGKSLLDHFPEVQFMDYTKSPERMTQYLQGKMPANYHLTFSRSEEKANQKLSESFLRSGGNVAVVFRDRLPSTWKGCKVVDGDETDLRFLDGKGVVVGLVTKGKAKADSTGFVVDPA